MHSSKTSSCGAFNVGNRKIIAPVASAGELSTNSERVTGAQKLNNTGLRNKKRRVDVHQGRGWTPAKFLKSLKTARTLHATKRKEVVFLPLKDFFHKRIACKDALSLKQAMMQSYYLCTSRFFLT